MYLTDGGKILGDNTTKKVWTQKSWSDSQIFQRDTDERPLKENVQVFGLLSMFKKTINIITVSEDRNQNVGVFYSN